MKNLVIYSTTYGFTEKCAQELVSKLKSSSELMDVKNMKSINWDEYDNVIIGGSIYVGQLSKPLKTFLNDNIDVLSKKRLGFFVCCGFPENFEQDLNLNIPKILLEKAVSKECFGGLMDISKMGFFHKLVTKMVTKATAKNGVQRMPEPLPQNIDKMAQAFNA